MRKFMVTCKDDITGYQMILSECSYNQAMAWLGVILNRHDMTCECLSNNDTGLTDIFIKDKNGNPCRTFYYDEERGYLLGE